MTLLAIAFMWIVGSIIMASEGDFNGFRIIGTVLLYIIMFGIFFWFLAVTGWTGVFLILFIGMVIAIFLATKE